MGGRTHILVVVMVVVAVAAVNHQSRDRDLLEELVQLCRNEGGEQAAEAFGNVPEQFDNCLQLEELSEELERSFQSGGIKQAADVVCTRNTEILKCFKQASETVQRCYNGKYQENFVALEQAAVAAMDSACDHVDDFVAIYSSPEEHQCLSKLEQSFPNCSQEAGIKNPLDIHLEDYSKNAFESIKFMNRTCRHFTGVQKCVFSSAGGCKNSRVFSLLDTLARDVVEEKLCAQNAGKRSRGCAGSGSEQLVLLGVAASLFYILTL